MSAPAQGGLWHRSATIAYLAVFVGVLGHASTEFVAKLSGVAGPELSVWRFVLGGGGLVLLALCLPGSRDLVTPLREAWRPLLGLSLVGVTLGYLVFHWSLDFATVPQVATTVTTMPILVALVQRWRTGQPITAVRWLSGIGALIGVALLLTDGALGQLAGGGRELFGMALALLCALFVGSYALLARPYIARYGALRITAISMALGALGLWLVVGAAWGVWVGPGRLAQHGPSQIAALLTIAFWNTTITQWLWLGGLAAVPDVTRGTYLFFLKPVIAAFLALVFLGTRVGPLEWAAIAIICGAVVLEAFWSLPRPAAVPRSA